MGLLKNNDNIQQGLLATMRNIPRNRIGGALADVLQAIKSNTGVVGDFMLGQAPEVVNNMSYGFNPTRGQGMTYGMKPEAADLANILPAATIGGLLGKSYSKLAGKELARQVQGKTGLLGRNAIDPRMNMVEDQFGRIAENGTDSELLARMLEMAGNKAGYNVTLESSQVSPSRYITFNNSNADNARQVRISNHVDKYPELASGVRYSSDPSTENTFEQAVNWLDKQGYPTSLSKRYENIPSYDEYLTQQQKTRELEKINEQEKLEYIRKNGIDGFVPNFEDLNISATKLNSGGRRYDVKNKYGEKKSVYSKDVPEEIKNNPDRSVLNNYLMNIYKK